MALRTLLRRSGTTLRPAWRRAFATGTDDKSSAAASAPASTSAAKEPVSRSESSGGEIHSVEAVLDNHVRLPLFVS